MGNVVLFLSGGKVRLSEGSVTLDTVGFSNVLRHDTLGGKTSTGCSVNTLQWMGARRTALKQVLFMNNCDLCHEIGSGI